MNIAGRLMLPGLLVLSQLGCYAFYSVSKVEVGEPLEDAKMIRIEPGVTTRGQVFDLLGVPHSIFYGQVEFVEERGVDFYSYRENRILNSLSVGQYAMLYRFGEASGKVHSMTFLVIGYEEKEFKIHADELLIFFDIDTDIVVDVALPGGRG